MIVLGDRNFAAGDLITQIAATGADVLMRAKNGRGARKLPVCRRLGDGSYLSRIGLVQVRVIDATITITTPTGQREASYRLITTVIDQSCGAEEIVRLYHQRWEIETAYCELKSTILGGRVLRARTPTGIEQEVYALLVAYQAIRIAIADTAIARPDLDPDQASFTVAFHAARDQIIKANRNHRRHRHRYRRRHRTPDPGRPAAPTPSPYRSTSGQASDIELRPPHRQRPTPRAQPPHPHQNQHPHRRATVTTTVAA